MRIEIANMMGVAREVGFDLEPGRVTAVIGPNMSGKTSLALAVGAVLTQEPNPLGLAATKRAAYIRDDADAGHVLLSAAKDREDVRWDLKDGEMTVSTRAMKRISPAAAGLIDFSTLAGKSAVAVWESLFLPPSPVLLKRIRKELEPVLDEDTIKGVMQTIQEQGWDSVDKVYGDRMRRAKTKWKGITGKTYGVRAASDWHPEGWLASYDGLTNDECEKRLRTAGDAMTALHVAHAITASEVEDAKEAAAELPGKLEEKKRLDFDAEAAGSKVRVLGEEVETVRQEGSAAVSKLEAHRHNKPSLDGDTLQCPHCEGPLLLVEGELRPHDPHAFDAALEEWTAKEVELRGECDDHRAQHAAAKKPLEAAESELEVARRAAATLDVEIRNLRERAKLADAKVTEDRSEEVEEANRNIESLRVQRDLVKQRAEAQACHESVQAYTLISTLLGPKGVRAKTMEASMTKVNEFLAIVAKTTGWPLVEVDRSYNVSIGRRAALRMCAESERWRAQAMLQIAISRLKREKAIVIDRGDVLDGRAQHELRTLCSVLVGREDPPAILVCATDMGREAWWVTDDEELPINLVKLGE